jgi:hydrogenase nickel incorporation protein HypA/HybF
MHEFRIATNILETVKEKSADIGRVFKVGLIVGDLSGVDIDALRFSFDAIVNGSEYAPIELEIERVPHQRCCAACGKTFSVNMERFDTACPGCGNAFTDFLSGDELEIGYLEVEDG